MQDNFSGFHHLGQENNNVKEYAKEFESYLKKCGVNEDEPQTLVRFLGGLESRIAGVVNLHPYTNLEVLIILAHKVERQQKIKARPESQRSYTRLINHLRATTPNAEPNPPKIAPTNPLVPQRNIPSPSLPPSNQRFMKRCYRCQEVGHIASVQKKGDQFGKIRGYQRKGR